jgi:hypothetical protein
VGLVSSAIFTDLDADGLPELVLACDWGPLRIFRNDRGRYVSWDSPLSWMKQGSDTNRFSKLSQLTGWWNSVAAGDLDGDGQIDLVAGNWGCNTARRRFSGAPVRLLFTEAGGTQDLGLLEAHEDPDLRNVVLARDWAALSGVFPVLRESFSSFTAFGAATLSEVMAAGLPPMREVSAASFESVVLLNRGDHFEARPLPIEAQLSPVFGIVVGDLDGDGDEDLFLAQNFFGVSPAESRQDAGCGLWLQGDGLGGFRAVPPHVSGTAVYGEGRGAALCDYDHDGRLDLVVGQNRGATKLFRNVRAQQGLRIHLQGPAANRQAVGAVARLVYRDGSRGPAHEIHLGGGYWSQGSTDLVLGIKHEAESLEIRWPGGVTERVSIPAGASSLSRNAP